MSNKAPLSLFHPKLPSVNRDEFSSDAGEIAFAQFLDGNNCSIPPEDLENSRFVIENGERVLHWEEPPPIRIQTSTKVITLLSLSFPLPLLEKE